MIKILDECINCGRCEKVCPTESISAGIDIYEVDNNTCLECKDIYDEEQCILVCPVECIINE